MIRVGYVVKRYPRYSETFIVNEIIAHEKAGFPLEIFSLRPSNDTHFQDNISRVKSSVNYMPSIRPKACDFWELIQEVSKVLPNIYESLKYAKGETTLNVFHAIYLAREVRIKNINHLHSHFASDATSVARLAAIFSGVTYTFTAHAKDIYHESVNHDILDRKLNDAAKVITISNFNLQYLGKKFNGHKNTINLIYNGLDLNQFQYSPFERRSNVIVSVGRLVEKKGFKDLIYACKIIADRNLDIKCEIIGTGPLEEELQLLIQTLNLKEKVKLVGPKPQNEVKDYIRNGIAFIVPCVIGDDGNRDGIPTVLLEAMAIGTPCIATNVTGIPEVVHHEKTGLIIAQHDHTAIADAFERLINDSLLCKNLTTNARNLVESNFDIVKNAASIRTVFHEVTKNYDKSF